MRILLGANHFFGDTRGGGMRVAWDVCKCLVSRGHDVTLLCEGVENRPESERVEGVRVLRYYVSKSDPNILSRHQRAGCKVLRKHLVDWKPDLLWGHMPLQAAAMIEVFPKVRLTYTVHSPVAMEFLESEVGVGVLLKLKSWLASRIERKCLVNASVICAHSNYTKSEIKRIHGEEISTKVYVTPGWTDVGKFRPVMSSESSKSELGWPLDRPVLFSLRRLVPRMGLDRLIEAAALVRAHGKHFELYIGGKGPLQESLQKQISDLNLGDCVRLIGAVSEAQLSEMYAAADAFVIPTRALECFGLIAVEAMSAGTPVLSTPVGALPEIISRIEPRWLARDNSAQSIAELMSDFIDGKLPVHASSKIREFVVANYSQENALQACVSAAIGELQGIKRRV
jgi:glycosyltransferase involved in cell wall biosynthesis